MKSPDIDIDVKDRHALVGSLPCVQAIKISSNGSQSVHPSGVYFQDVPTNPATGVCAFDFEEAADHGYFKIDLCSSNVYNDVADEDHLDRLISEEPDWCLLEDENIVAGLFHISRHFNIVETIKPKSIEDLSVVLALIRAQHLIHLPRAEIDACIWDAASNSTGYSFKRAHAIAYAHIIVMQMNLIVDKVIEDILLEENAETSARGNTPLWPLSPL